MTRTRGAPCASWSYLRDHARRRCRQPGRPLRVGILGAGMIATVEPGYLPGLRRLHGRVEVTAIASRTRSRAERVARDWDIPAVYDGLSQMLAAPGIDAVVNLTPIAAHYQTSRKILSAGKHLVTEKPLASTLEAGTRPLPSAARARHVLEIMLTAQTAAATGRTVPLTTTLAQEP